MRIEVAVSERARYRVKAESAQGRTWAGNVLLFDIRCMNTPTSVYAEMTPNPEVMKFVADRPLIEGNAQAEFTSKADCAGRSSFAEELFNFPFVTGVFISGGFVSVTKDDTIGWEMIAMQMREYIQQWLTEHPVAVEKVPPPKATTPMPEAAPTAGEPVVALADDDIVPTEHDEAIAALLEEFVRPAVEADGGIQRPEEVAVRARAELDDPGGFDRQREVGDLIAVEVSQEGGAAW